MHVPINVKSPNNASKWQMGFNSAFKGLSDLARYSLPVRSFMLYTKTGHRLIPHTAGWRG